MFYHEDCRWFTGYKPCHFKRDCKSCPHYKPVKTRIAIVSLDAMGAVLRSTCLLAPLKRKYPESHITWITYPQSKALLENNPLIDRLVALDGSTTFALQYLKFDLAFGVDKSIEAGALVESINAEKKLGFGLDYQGVIRPLNLAAEFQYNLGLNDNLKFFENQKPETQQITETMELTWDRDQYILELTESEKKTVLTRKKNLFHENLSIKGIIGYNTGCSTLFPYKKFTIKHSIDTIKAWRKDIPEYGIILLGGKEDSQRQDEIKQAFQNDPYVVNTPTHEGLRSGILWMDTADLVFSGCSLGMHIAIGLKKKVVAWFGVSCIQEIDLYDRGIKLQSDVSCSPCWKKKCSKKIKCFDQVSTQKIVHACKELL